MGALYLLSPWATIGFPLLSGAVLVAKGFQVSDSLLYVGISLFGPTLGSLAASLGIDRLERRLAIVLCALIMAVAALAFGISSSPAVILTAGVVFNLVGAVYVSTASVYTAEIFPTRLRASVASSAWAVNRVSSMLMPFVLLPLLKIDGPIVMLAVIAGILGAIAAMILVFGPRGRAGQPVA
jgi:putative MFS transporter